MLTGGTIEADIEARQLNHVISEDELARRKAAWRPRPLPSRDYSPLSVQRIS